MAKSAPVLPLEIYIDGFCAPCFMPIPSYCGANQVARKWFTMKCAIPKKTPVIFGAPNSHSLHPTIFSSKRGIDCRCGSLPNCSWGERLLGQIESGDSSKLRKLYADMRFD